MARWQVSLHMSHGEINVPPVEAEPPQEEVTPPAPRVINYNGRIVEVCKSCGIPASGDKPLLVFRMITPTEGSAHVLEILAHRPCIGILLAVHSRSLFQIKYTLNGKET